MTDARWQCRDCGALVYPYCERCPHCGAARPTSAEIVWEGANRTVDEALARGERPSFPPGAPLTTPANGPIENSDAVPWERPESDKHGALPPVDWKARHAAVKTERGGK